MSCENTDSELISKAFLEEKIGRKIESFKIKAGSEPGDNYLSIIYSLDVKISSEDNDFDENEDTLYLLCKCYPKNPARQVFLNKMNLFWKEIVLYKEWIPELIQFQKTMGFKEKIKPAFAPFVTGEAVDFEKDKNATIKVYQPFDIFIMMIDLRTTFGFKMVNRQMAIDRDHAALTITALADIHALSWVYKQKNNIEDITDKFPSICYNFDDEKDRQLYLNISDGSTDSTLDAIKALVGNESALYKGAETFTKVAAKCADILMGYGENGNKELDNFMRIKPEAVDSSKDIPWKVVIHGDCWINNLLFRYNRETGKPEEVVFVDLQMFFDACPTNDLALFIYLSSDSEFRKTHLDAMLQIYTDRFNSVCQQTGTDTLPGFSFLELKRRFHRAKLFGLIMAFYCLPIVLKDKEDMADLDSMKGNMEEIFSTLGEGSHDNLKYGKRMMGILQDMYDDGII